MINDIILIIDNGVDSRILGINLPSAKDKNNPFAC